MKKQSAERISPNELLSLIGKTPADNVEGYHNAVPWKSRLAGGQVRSLFRYQELMKTVAGEPLLFGPWATLAGWQATLMESYVTGPIKTQARTATRAGRNPDVFAEMNSWIYQTYARLLQNLCSGFMRNGKFDRRVAQEISTSEEGKQLLRNYMKEFRWLELSYNSRGLTRLKAMKDLLKSLLVLITEQPIDDMPFMKKNPDGSDGMSLGAYLEEGRARIDALWRHNAFDIRDFADRFMGGRIGFLPYEVIKGSRLHSVTLRYYPLPKGVEPNGKVVYLATPMINRPEIFDLAEGKSVVEGMLKEGYHVYLVDHGDPGPRETNLGLDFYGKTVPDAYIEIIQKRHPGAEIYIMAYCMAGTLMLPYLARRAEERLSRGEPMDVWKIAVMASPVKFDDGDSGHAAMRKIIREEYDPLLDEGALRGSECPGLHDRGGDERNPARRPAHACRWVSTAAPTGPMPSRTRHPSCTGSPTAPSSPPGPTASGSASSSWATRWSKAPTPCPPPSRNWTANPCGWAPWTRPASSSSATAAPATPSRRRAPAYPASCGARSGKTSASPAGD